MPSEVWIIFPSSKMDKISFQEFDQLAQNRTKENVAKPRAGASLTNAKWANILATVLCFLHY